MTARRIEVDLSGELVEWLERHRYSPDLGAAVVYVLEQTKRAEDDERLTERMEREFPPPEQAG